MTSQTVGDLAHHRRIRKHSRFHRGRPQVVGDGVDLRANELRIDRGPGRNTKRVLRGDRRNDRRAEHAKALKRLQVCLNSSTTAGVRSGDGQCNGSCDQFPGVGVVAGDGGCAIRRALNVWKFGEF